MDVTALSSRFAVRALGPQDLPAALVLCLGNPLFYQHCPPAPTPEGLAEDLTALPPRKTMADKHYVGFFDGDQLVALLDLIEGYPTPDIAFIGFFMLDVTRQGQGLGSDMVEELCRALADRGFSAVRLGWVRGNEQATHFWHKNGFVETGATNVTDAYTVVVAERPLYRA